MPHFTVRSEQALCEGFRRAQKIPETSIQTSVHETQYSKKRHILGIRQ